LRVDPARRDPPPAGGEHDGQHLGKREFKLPWREAGPLDDHDDKVDSDQ